MFSALELLLILPLIGLGLCLLVSRPLAANLAFWLSLAAHGACLLLWGHTPASVVLPLAQVDFSWVGALGMRFELAVTTLRLALLWGSLVVVTMAFWANRSSAQPGSTALLLVCQLGLIVFFTAQNYFLMLVSLESVYAAIWTLCLLAAQPSKRQRLLGSVGWLGVSTALFVGAGAILIGLHTAQFQVPTSHWASLLDLASTLAGPGQQGAWAQWAFWLLVGGALVRAAIVPTHTWLAPLFESPSVAARMLLVGLPFPILVLLWTQWILVLFPDAYAGAAPGLAVFVTLGAIYSAFLASKSRRHVDWLKFTGLFFKGAGLAGLLLFSAASMGGTVLLALSWAVVGPALAWLSFELQKQTGVDDFREAGASLVSRPKWAFSVLALLACSSCLPLGAAFGGTLLILSGAVKTVPLLALGLALAWTLSLVATLKQALGLWGTSEQNAESWDIGWASAALVLVLLWVNLAMALRPALLREALEAPLNAMIRTRLKVHCLGDTGVRV